MNYTSSMGFPGGSEVKNLLANAGDADLIPGSGRSPGGGRATHPSIFAWVRNPGQRNLVAYIVHGRHKQLDMTDRLSTHTQ